MKITPRYLVQLSSAEIVFLHSLVQRQVRGVMGERPEGRGMDPAVVPPELVSLDRRLLTRLREVSDDEEVYFGKRRTRPEAGRINEEHAVLAEIAALGERGSFSGSAAFRGASCNARPGRRTPATDEVVQSAASKALAVASIRQGSNVIPLHTAGQRQTARVG